MGQQPDLLKFSENIPEVFSDAVTFKQAACRCLILAPD
jgi:hypothetical protein